MCTEKICADGLQALAAALLCESDVDAVTRIKQPRRDDSGGGGGGMDGGGMDRGSWSELQAGDGGFDLDEGLQLAFAGNTFALTSPVPRDVDSPLMMES